MDETMTVVYPPWWASPTLGMEYPTLILNGPGDPLIDSDLMSGVNMGEIVTAHEFAHQYFYAMVGSNEFEEAYMDEGFTQYWGDRIMEAEYGDEAGIGTILGRDLSVVTFDDDLSYYANRDTVPYFTAMRSPVRLAGQRCAARLIERVGNKDAPHVEDLLEAELVVGRSTAPPR